MKPRKVKKLLLVTAISACLSPWAASYAAEQQVFWGNIDDYAPLLKNFTLVENPSTPNDLSLPLNLGTQKNPAQTLHFASGRVDNNQKSHVRYNQYYHDIPVWGSQVVYHVSSTGTLVTGGLINHIEKDITDLQGKISIDEAKKIALGKHAISTKINAEKIIYFNEASSKAVLAYHVSYLLRGDNGPSIPSFIIDANTGKVLEKWNALPTAEIGQGPGGVNVNGRLPYRPGNFQFGSLLANTNSLGKLDVEFNAGVCTISNNLFRVINLRNRLEQQLPYQLPASSADERRYRIQPFAYSCSAPNYVNSNDGGTAPINDGLSPINDTTYFIKQTFNMLTNQYQVPTPVGNQLPIRVYTHLGYYDNAFACGPTCMLESGIVGPQTLVFGNGLREFSPITDGDGVSHEFGHLVTENFSNLVYANHPGGINESFSDMTGMAMLYYQRNTLGYSWYWDGKDWTTGASVSKTGRPLRYLDNPRLDGRSIDNVSQYRKGMDPHNSSGVFNKAYYLLSTTLNWNAEKAYRVMLDANMNYWTKNTTFKMAACGVMQAARDRAYPAQDVKNAFTGVGINMENCATT